jgi:hypothetical protein
VCSEKALVETLAEERYVQGAPNRKGLPAKAGDEGDHARYGHSVSVSAISETDKRLNCELTVLYRSALNDSQVL